MKKYIFILIFLLIPIGVFGQQSGSRPLTVQEIDDFPQAKRVDTIKVTNGTLTKTSERSVTLDMGSLSSILSPSGTLTTGGVGGTNNENLIWDFESNANTVGVSSGTGVSSIAFNHPVSTKSSQSSGLLGTELVTNGTFTTDLTGWAGANWDYDTGEASHTAGATTALTQNITTVSGTAYHIAFTITDRSAGTVTLNVNGVYIYNYASTTTFTTSATYTRSIVASSSASVVLSITPSTDFNGDIDNISIKSISVSTANAKFIDDSGDTAIEIRGDAGLYNTFIGLGSGQFNTTGISNTANGWAALYSNTTGFSNTANGRGALRSNTTGSTNTANGRDALYSNTTGTSNTANGWAALRSNTTGYENTANGRDALYSNTSGISNTANGRDALYSNTTGYENTANGWEALRSNTTGISNTANGWAALRSNTTGISNTANGRDAGRYIANGTTANTTSDYCVFLGKNTKALADDDQNEIVIGYNATGRGSNTAVIGNSDITLTEIKGLEVTKTTTYVPSATTNITAAGGITVTSTIMRVQGNGGAINITADPQIVDGQDGQIVYVQGDSDTNTLTLDDGTGLQLAAAASCVLGLGDIIQLTYDAGADLWLEISRSDN